MGENQGVIWVLIGALVLGVAIFAMGSYFSNQTESQQVSIAFQQQAGVDAGTCKASGGEFIADTTVPPEWSQGDMSDTAPTTDDGYALSTGVCEKGALSTP